jgi:S1-C subfamily serine protease
VVEIASTTGLGSGVVYDGDGNIVTNAHVVGDETQFQVTFGDGRQLPGTLVGSYAPDDLAVVRVSGGRLPPAVRWADSSKVRVGELCLAIGNPLGLASSVTSGIVDTNGTEKTVTVTLGELSG